MNSKLENKFKNKLIKRNAKKKQQTEWIFTASYASKTYIKIGIIHNKSKGNPFDIIALKIRNANNEILSWETRIDEAQILIFGLSKVLTQIITDVGVKGKYLRQFMEYFGHF